MRILIANDDGIDAPGIALLRQAAARVASDIWVVAPERKWTAASHHLSFDKELTLSKRESQVYALNGSIYVWQRAALAHAAEHGLWSVNVGVHVMPRWKSVDIDDLDDFEYAQWLAQRHQATPT